VGLIIKVFNNAKFWLISFYVRIKHIERLDLFALSKRRNVQFFQSTMKVVTPVTLKEF